MLPVAASSDEVTNVSNTPCTRLFIASPTTPTLHSPVRSGTSPSWGRRLPFAVCSCGRRAGPLDTPATVARCCAEERRRQFELDRLSPSVCNTHPQCRRSSADDVNGGVFVDTSTLSDCRRRTLDEPVYLPLGLAAPNGHYLRCSVAGQQDHACISDGRIHDNPDLLFAS